MYFLGHGSIVWTHLAESSAQAHKPEIKRLAHLNMGFPGSVSGKNLLASAGDIRDPGLIPGLGRSLGGGHGNPLQYSGLENPMDRGAWHH